jgi:hypothetical protein
MLIRRSLGNFKQLIGISIVTLFQAACGPGVRPVSDPAAHLDKCGVSSEGVVSAGQAKCVARLAGLARGARPWEVEDKRWLQTGDKAWKVCNTLKVPTDRTPSEGMCMFVRKSDGEILATFHTVLHSKVY